MDYIKKTKSQITNAKETVMNCPVCDAKLRTIDKMGVQIEICPECKGIWLDKGELDKLMEMAAVRTADFDASGDCYEERPKQQPAVNGRGRHDDLGDRYDHSDDGRSRTEHGRYRSEHDQRKKRSSWLSEILGGLGGDD